MTFAKLSGSLLARKDAPAATTLADLVSVPRVAPAPAAAPGASPDSKLTVAAPTAPAGKAEELLTQHLKALKLPAFLREYDKVARQCAADGLDPSQYLLRLTELELLERDRRLVERRVKGARFPAVKDLDSFDFSTVPSLDKNLVRELADCEYIARRENILLVGNSGTGKTHIAVGLGFAACRNGLSVGFVTAGALMHQLLELHDERRLLHLRRQLAAYKLLIIDELGYVPLSTAAAELFFDIVSNRYERGSTIVTTNVPLDEWAHLFGSAQLAGAVLERLTHHSHVLDTHGESYRLRQSERRPSRRHGNGVRSAAERME
jgi:DNA replication protein DnaC